MHPHLAPTGAHLGVDSSGCIPHDPTLDKAVMTAHRNSADQYLQKVGGTYYARVRVPRTLEKYTGQTHIRKSLATGSRAEANLKKHTVVASIKKALAELRRKPPSAEGLQGDHSLDSARSVRERIEQLRAEGDEDQAEAIEMYLPDFVQKMEALHGAKKADRWWRTATSNDVALSELMATWLDSSDYRESTKAGHRNALSHVLEFFEDPGAVPADVTRGKAIEYIDKHLNQAGLAHSTMRDRLVSLGGFWAWMASRNIVPEHSNPWTGHRVSKKQNAGSRPPKRTYTDPELLALLKGTPEAKAWPTYSYLPDLIVLGMYTGAREEELCSLRASQLEITAGRCVIKVTDAKTKAGERLVAVVHPAPLAVIKRRLPAAKKGTGQLFPELKPGGLDAKFSFSAVKAFGRYRRACGVPDGTDFHSFRRNVITVLEQAGVGQVPIARFVGHKVGTMAGDVYSAGGSKALALEVAAKVRYSSTVEKALATASP